MGDKLAISVVVIGRNEGERLRICLGSLLTRAEAASAAPPLVYVDSGSTDGSVALAQSLGADVVQLDMRRPFSAARARNEGFERLIQLAPEAEYVQFVDGDCAVGADWLEAAGQFLEANPQHAVVCGRLRERFPERSIYNRLCEMEWNRPAGDTETCGGIAMYRADAFEQAGHFGETVIAGEEPELCLRLRKAGWKIRHLSADMALHDAAMVCFSQWWTRAVRGGYAYALGAAMHGASAERYRVKETRSIWFWGLLLPLANLILWWPTRGLSLALLCGYLVLVWRVYRQMRARAFSPADARLYALFCVLAKFPQVQGQLCYWWGRLTATPSSIIEYKAVSIAGRDTASH